jgi:hypothetical protein
VTYLQAGTSHNSAAVPTHPEEEGGYGYEYASDHQGAKESHVEAAVLVQPLSEGAFGGESEGSSEGARSFVSFGSTVPLCKAGSEGPCARETGGGGPACPPRFAVCRNYKHRHEISRHEAERVAGEERKLGQDAGCTLFAFGVGLATDPVIGAGSGFLCGLL